MTSLSEGLLGTTGDTRSSSSWCKPVAYIKAQMTIVHFYFYWIPKFKKIHPDILSGKLMSDSLVSSEQEVHEVTLDAKFKDDFNLAYDELKQYIARTVGKDDTFLPILIGSWLARVLQCYVAWTAGCAWALLAGLTQFFVAPLSLTSSFIRLLTNLSDCAIHYTINGLVVLVGVYFIPLKSGSFLASPRIKFDTTFVVSFFAADFIANMYHYLWTSERFGFCRLLKHILYGSFNTKTYFVVVLGCLFGLEIDVWTWLGTGVITWVFMEKGYGVKLLRFLGLPSGFVTFYLEHRIGHCPVVYTHAHKMHHYLHDSTAFDAHIYGSGMNEEYFWICAEVLPCVLTNGLLFPYFFNIYTLYVSWTNKSGHTRNDQDSSVAPWGCDEDNFHADHHVFHRANFGYSTNPILDFYFGTQGATTVRVVGRSWEASPDGKGNIVLRVAPMTKQKRAKQYEIDAALNSNTEVEKAQPGMTAQVENVVDWSYRIVSKAELQQKTTAENGLWVALYGAVFDLTVFQRLHPGGAAVLSQYAGTDATQTYEEVSHPARAQAWAMKYAIGRLEDTMLEGFVKQMAANSVSRTPSTSKAISKPTTMQDELRPEAKSGNGTLQHIGIKLHGKFNCQECHQRFDSQSALELHWKFIHDPSRHQED